jgi:hypothetical protein
MLLPPLLLPTPAAVGKTVLLSAAIVPFSKMQRPSSTTGSASVMPGTVVPFITPKLAVALLISAAVRLAGHVSLKNSLCPQPAASCRTNKP